MFDIYDVTEADETATSKEAALRHYVEQRKLYNEGESTMGILDMYAQAAFNVGCYWKDLETAWVNHLQSR